MVNNVSFNGGYKIPYQDFEKAAKYAMGSTLVMHEENPMDGMGSMLGFMGIIEGGKGIKWAWDAHKNPLSLIPEGLKGKELKKVLNAADPLKNGGWHKAEGWKTSFKNLKKGWTEVSDLIKGNHATKMELIKNGGLKNLGTYKNLITDVRADKIVELMPKAKKMEQLAEIAGKSKKAKLATEYFKKAKEAAELAKNTPAEAGKFLKKADKYLAKANKYAHGLIKPTSLFGKFKGFLGKITGFSKLSGALKNLATKSPAMAKCLKFIKGNALFIAIEGGLELITNVIPTFAKLGVGKGLKQTVKSTVKVAASVGGWAAGGAAGAAIGTLIGGPIGTVVGGVLGLALGAIGGWITGKIAKAVVGKDELEIAREEEAKKLAEEASQNPEVAQQVLLTARQRLEQEGMNSEDAKIAAESINNITKAIPVPASTTTKTTAAYTNTANNTAYSYNPFSSNPEQNWMQKDFMMA